MLKDERNSDIDLLDTKDELIEYLPEELQNYISEDDTIYELKYPTEEYPIKVKSLNFDKFPEVGGLLKGIRGQYLIFEGGEVINLRKFTGYNIKLTVGETPTKVQQKTLF